MKALKLMQADKQVWTTRQGIEYAWWNNVESKPGIGYPKDWENQERWRGGWVLGKGGALRPKTPFHNG